MQTVTKKSVVESPSSRPTTAKEPDIASASVADPLVALPMNSETGLPHAEGDTRHAAVRAAAGAVAVTAVIELLRGLLAGGRR